MNIEYTGRNALITVDGSAFTYEVNESPRDFKTARHEDSLDWKQQDFFIGGWRIHPYGDNNDLPTVIKQVVQNNSDAPGIMKKKTQLLWGKGPKLYTEVFENNELVKRWVEDPIVQSWLDSWDYEDYLLKNSVDFAHVEGTFTKYILNKGSRVGKNKFINKLEQIPPDKIRLASVYIQNKITNPTHAILTDFAFSNLNALTEMKVYKLFDRLHPFAYPNTIFYSNMYSFCKDYYTIPDMYGALEWLRRSTAIPIILKALSKNSINIKYHVISPQKFWDNKREELKRNATERGIDYKESMLREYEKSLLEGVAKVLSGESNTGKFWHTKKTFEVDATNLIEHGWEIKPIDQNVKDFVSSQIEISNHASLKVSTSIGVHSALGNVGEKGKADSGSEQLYALQNYLATGIDIPEMIITKPINMAIKANWPEKNVKLGFYHTNAKREQDITPSQRHINQ
jgi:hypothetical protein